MTAGRGFTLLELLVVFAILALVMMIVGGGIGTGTRSWDRAHARATRLEDLLALDRFLSGRLQQAVPLRLRAADGKQRPLAFIGGRDGMMFVAPMPEGLDLAGYSAIELRHQPSEHRLRLDWARAEVAGDGLRLGDERRSVTLLEDIGGIVCRYLGRRTVGGERQWRTEWPAGPLLPDLVEVTVTGRDGARWPPIRVRPRVTAPSFAALGGST